MAEIKGDIVPDLEYPGEYVFAGRVTEDREIYLGKPEQSFRLISTERWTKNLIRTIALIGGAITAVDGFHHFRNPDDLLTIGTGITQIVAGLTVFYYSTKRWRLDEKFFGLAQNRLNGTLRKSLQETTTPSRL
ncbi:hypothetical protein A3C32_00905 [Candidatus Daviesbacteria bacterium RIFCSPHIGHO2_02_FULL_41_14]|uniref:Uncharacterized protein n=1 Tax=Candidatus Daviesbacteria bacterium RIFCSPLOWO2_01_FULL_40_24 TaxID=1797787 RepID=A0A1F5MKJ6_9BACT|nr:MAG: hypothetical protein A2780_02210 [Candidatus Daviesbacteria bacterium RIFCSPHIGHO2_01_FULL_41_45]OGE34138.1 MAG: hypothetical protein A3C32_00905 [Candidatus Daviesbacteria bacterium RIFCSPHIGHO2_02_FULL_41_14]OGE65820.1 MAG: hypothetical protein A3B49_03410 [Candidatus Daviesbacteria bacterium RIFCSPLOWO2_01_FULL_40_24]